MSKSNGQADIHLEEQTKETLERELPPADPNDGFEEKRATAESQDASSPETSSGIASPAEAPAETEMQKLQAERASLLDRMARLQAEFDNYRKRAAKENADFRDYAVADAARSLLPVVDNFSLALKNASAKPEDFRTGIELIHKQLQDVLQKLNV